MKILYLKNSDWELDFIVNDILFHIKDKEVEFFTKESFKTFLNRDDLVDNNILIVNTVCNINDIIEVISYIKPITIFYLSDECGGNNDTTLLQNYTKLVFRQYNHVNYKYEENNHQLVLGYSRKFLKGLPSFSVEKQKMCDRKITASFVGAMKSDRYEMIYLALNNMVNTHIRAVNHNWNIDNLPCSPEECFNIYNNSAFVICGRGNCNLDCFRIYEAIAAGSIPVIVGPWSEITNTFYYQNNLIPCVYDETWEGAISRCNYLLSEPDKLQKMQDTLLSWWDNQLSSIQSMISKEIERVKGVQ